MAKLSKYKLEEYQYGVDVRKGRQLYMMSEKKIYFGEWLIGTTDQIIIIEMSKQIADREAPFYLEANGHENIIRTFGSIGNPSNLTIFIQEFAPEGDLADCLMDNQFQFTQTMLVQMFAQIADAMSYVASKKIVHGDLGCRNVLVFRVDSNRPRNNLVKITDFGLARWIEHPPENEDPTLIPVRYCAPEILRHNHHLSYSEKSDVYSMGVLIWEALSNSEIPYSSVDKDEDVKYKKLNNERLQAPKPCDRQLWVLMNSCWHRDPQKRPTFDEIKDRLVEIKISEISHDLITASSHKEQLHCDYELDIHVKIKRLLNDGYPSIYEAQWISEEEKRPIVLIEKKEEPSFHEKLFYTTFKNHPHIVDTFGFVENDRGSIMILQERAPYGNLQSLLESGQFQPSGRVLIEIFSQIINAMIDIVGEGLVHGDLCCENILVFEMHPSDPRRNSVKLSNFTLARPNDPSHTDDRRLFVPVRYCALQILRSAGRSNYSELSDVYSLGVLMWQAYSKGKRPYDSSETNGEVRQRKLKGEKLPKPLVCDDQMWSIMQYCWLDSTEIQFTFKELKTQFAKIDFKSIDHVLCYSCKKNFLQNEIENHQKICVRPMSPVNYIDQHDTHITRSDYDNNGYDDSDKENSPEPRSTKRPRIEAANSNGSSTQSDYSNKRNINNVIEVHQGSPEIKRKSVASVEEPMHYRSCKHCHEPYPDGLLEEHEMSYCRKRFPPVVTTPPEPIYVDCVNCNKKFTTNEIANHRRICQPKPVITINESKSVITINQPTPGGSSQNRPHNQPPTNKRSQPPSRGCWARFWSCLCFSK